MTLLAPPLISLFLFSGFVVAQINAPGCSTTWIWSFNSLTQNACTVAAYMISTCYEGSFTIDALQTGDHYTPLQGAGLCLCNTITYSLLSACEGCQGSDWISWSDYASNCTVKLPPSSFPNPIPAGTRLPQWALLNVTSENIWNETNAIAVGDSPELDPGTILGPAGPSGPFSALTVPITAYPPASTSSAQAPVFSTSATSSSSNATTSIQGPGGYNVVGHSSNTGAIAGGTVGGMVAISIVIALVIYFQRRHRSRAQYAPFTGYGQAGAYKPQDSSRLVLGQETATSSLPASASLMRLYNADDPSTFPGYQVAPNPSYTYTQASSLSNTRNLYTVATPPGPEARG